MPRKNLGLGYLLTRYHRIGTPAERLRVEEDRPLECALCHENRSVAFLIDKMERWWGRRYSRRHLRNLYGDDLSVNVLRATLRRGKPHEQIVAVAVLGQTRNRAWADEISRRLTHPYPLVRNVALQALFDLYGEHPDIDVDADSTTIENQTKRWLKSRQ